MKKSVKRMFSETELKKVTVIAQTQCQQIKGGIVIQEDVSGL